MLIESVKYISKNGGNPRNLVLEGQDINYATVGMCKMNMVLDGIEDFRIEYGDLSRESGHIKFTTGYLRRFNTLKKLEKERQKIETEVNLNLKELGFKT